MRINVGVSTMLCLLVATVHLNAQPAVDIVTDGRAAATIVIADDAPEQVRSAAELLARYVEQSTGAALPIAQTAPAHGIAIYVGTAPTGVDFDLAGLDDDGFDILFPDASTIVIIGPNPWGTEFGVYDFLERYVGVRWVMPGPDGTHVPSARSISVPAEAVRSQPAFFSRQFSGLRGSQVEWARRNRMHGRVQFHHNLRELFNWETYPQTHPHFFPLRAGVRFVPTQREGWQPCFTAEGSVEEAIRVISAYFDEDPSRTSYSLGINDNRNFCQCENCMAKVGTENNFLGYPDYSDLYYEWCNKVVEGVLEQHPDKWFGLLAYHYVGAPPRDIEVNPRIIPYMTYDRMKWIHPELRADGEMATRDWASKSPTVGWYDYIYGRPYQLPRVWFHHMADYYRFGHANQVRALYAEAYPNWGEGPKLYVSLKLQWDPNLDVDALLEDWYVACAGEEAAPLLAQYYAHWEDFWTRRILDSPWFTLAGQYLPHKRDPSYLLLPTEEELAQCRTLLEGALEATATDDQRARVQVLLDGFDFYEASALCYQAGAGPHEVLTTEAEALAKLARTERAFEMATRRDHMLNEVLPNHPVLHNVAETPLFPSDRGLMEALLCVLDFAAREGGTVAERVRALEQQYQGTEIADTIRAVLLVHDEPDRLVECIVNGSFEETGAAEADVPAGLDWTAEDAPPSWSKWIRPATTAQIIWTAEDAHEGRRSVKITGATACSLLQRVQVQPGEHYMVSVQMRAHIGPTTVTRLSVQWQDATGAWHDAPAVLVPLEAGETDGWVRRTAFFKVPEGVARAVLGLGAQNQGPDDYACFDNVSMKRITLD